MNTKTLFPDQISSKLITSSRKSSRKKISAKSSAVKKITFHAHSFTELVQFLNQKRQESSVEF